jgi:bifunctional ADP-heptose synthase (sugar kinase/adenylyltransferase)
MDSREKIVDLARAAEIAAALRSRGARVRLLAGYFDVLTPELVRGLRALAGPDPLIAAVLDPARPLLPSHARAELAAALSVIDYVLLPGDSCLDRVIAEIRPDEVIRDERDSQALIEYVHRRQRG